MAAASRGRHRTAALVEAAATRELAVLADGPWAPRWYWRDDLEAMQAASRRMGYPPDHPAAELRCYRPTEEFRPHPDGPKASGRVWRYQAASAWRGERHGERTQAVA